uniref:Putative ovule protein n=2 Tax=Solanum chacoense TaxID=4108 RepID=A0A0V0GXD9_SOLCH
MAAKTTRKSDGMPCQGTGRLTSNARIISSSEGNKIGKNHHRLYKATNYTHQRRFQLHQQHSMLRQKPQKKKRKKRVEGNRSPLKRYITTIQASC